MKIYKNWYKKFVQACAHRKLNNTYSTLTQAMTSNSDRSNRIDTGLSVSTLLPHSLIQQLFILLLALAALVLAYRLKISKIFAIGISIFIVLGYLCDTWQLIVRRRKWHSLYCVDHLWFLQHSNRTHEPLDIQNISQGLGFLYVLNFVSKESQNKIRICVWKYQSNPEFLSYCSQLLLIGKKDIKTV